MTIHKQGTLLKFCKVIHLCHWYDLVVSFVVILCFCHFYKKKKKLFVKLMFISVLVYTFNLNLFNLNFPVLGQF